MAKFGQPKTYGYLQVRLWAAATLSMLATTPAIAEENDSGAPEGAFIILRDVNVRPAEGPGTPAKPDYVMLGGKDTVLGSLGIAPMSDLEQSQVTADLPPQHNVITDAIGSSLDHFTSDRGATQTSLASERSSFIGGSISGAMSAIPAAMGALQSALGSGQ
jgi:hypothetical protein